MKIVIWVLLCIFCSCKTKEFKKNNLTNKSKTMKIFDSKKYRNLKIDSTISPSENDTVYLNQNKKIRITHSNDKIQEVERVNGSPYELTNIYFHNKKLSLTVNKFYNIPTGISQKYNEQGALIEEKDWDENFKFYLNDLIKKMNTEFNIDILNIKKTLIVNRYLINQDKKRPVYEISTRTEIGSEQIQSFLIDGNSGKLLFITKHSMGDKNGSLLDQYLNSL